MGVPRPPTRALIRVFVEVRLDEVQEIISKHSGLKEVGIVRGMMMAAAMNLFTVEIDREIPENDR
ncbi:hypothetical protein KIN20_035830 [Parelaphostrongylus tenuis]|uniref:Uncharacterized protein n=1 Tax=Parelaphostrongylus tenuis TaxID=148309 RepID=A0AAD5RCD3_PARTN|nr:hypothetical protein KIN20_035830 [Parelaphostrongylus tenuis]